MGFYFQYYTDNSFRTLVTGCLIGGGHLMSCRLTGVRLYYNKFYFTERMLLLSSIQKEKMISHHIILFTRKMTIFRFGT